MFGLTFEKLLVILVIAVVIVGPKRLPLYAEKLASFTRSVRDFTKAAKVRAEAELGVPIDAEEWGSKIQQYDPRTIIRDALTRDEELASTKVQPAAATDPPPETAQEPVLESDEQPAVEMRERWVIVGGSSGHPVRRKILEPIESEPLQDAPIEYSTR